LTFCGSQNPIESKIDALQTTETLMHKKHVRAGHRLQRGLTLIELMLVIAVSGVISYAAYQTYTSTSNSASASAEANNLTAINAKVHNLYAGRGAYTNLSNTVLANVNGFPPSMILTSATPAVATNTWGGTVTVLPASPGFTIEYANVTVQGCAELLNLVNGGSFRGIFGTQSTAATDNTAQAYVTSNNAAGSTPDLMTAACSNWSGNNSSNRIDLTFYGS
jgi:prepilin-type N-terminal cleavage/methylation domain-containing protein